MRSAIVTIFRLCLWQYAARSSARAIVPSSFWISQITTAGMSPASRARSIDASVWPVRSSTPPALALSGCTCPPTMMSSGPLLGSTATCIVCAWSCTLMPVVTPSRASIVTVNGVWCGVSFLAAISSRPSSSQRSGGSARQIQPPACRVMKLIASGVTNWAAITRSPSFSRSSSSTTTTILPAAMASSASSMVANSTSVRGTLDTLSHQLLHVLRHHVHLQVDLTAHIRLSQGRARERLGNQRDVERLVVDAGDREAHPVDRDRALLDRVAQHLRRRLHRQHAREAVLAHRGDDADPVDVALDDVTTEAVARAQCQLEVDAGPRLELAQRGAAQRLVHHVGAEARPAQPDRRQAHTVDRHRVALADLARQRRLEAQPRAVGGAVDRGDRAQVRHETSEHQRFPRWSRAGQGRAADPSGKDAGRERWWCHCPARRAHAAEGRGSGSRSASAAGPGARGAAGGTATTTP